MQILFKFVPPNLALLTSESPVANPKYSSTHFRWIEDDAPLLPETKSDPLAYSSFETALHVTSQLDIVGILATGITNNTPIPFHFIVGRSCLFRLHKSIQYSPCFSSVSASFCIMLQNVSFAFYRLSCIDDLSSFICSSVLFRADCMHNEP
jgi:hypothetical protein